MSELIELEVSGEKDKGCITPAEILDFCIKHNVDRINSMEVLWVYEKKDEEYTETTIATLADCYDLGKEGYVLKEETNTWLIDIN